MITAFFRTVLLYVLLIIGLRLTGKRQIGQLEPIEFVLMMLLSDLASVPMQDFGLPLLQGVIPIATLLAISTLLSGISLLSIRFRSLICGEPTIIIRDGTLQQAAMSRSRLPLEEEEEEASLPEKRRSAAEILSQVTSAREELGKATEVLEELRVQGVSSLDSVKYAVLETSGQLSVLLRADVQPATPRQMGLKVDDDVFLPVIIIDNGRLMAKNLEKMGLDDKWLQKQLKAHKTRRIQDVFLMTVDRGGTVVLVKKEAAK